MAGSETVDSDCELHDGLLKKKVRRKEERNNSKEIVNFIAEKENKSTGDLQCFNFQFFTEREILGGPIDKIVSSPNDDGFARLEDIFEKCQRERAIGLLLRILDFTIACAQSSASWYVIDSHARNSRGMADENGSSVVLKFSNFHALLFYLRSFVETTTSERDLDVNDLTFETLTLNVNERMPTESQDVLILSVSTL